MASNTGTNQQKLEITTNWLSIKNGSLQWNGKIVPIANISMLGSSNYQQLKFPVFAVVIAFFVICGTANQINFEYFHWMMLMLLVFDAAVIGWCGWFVYRWFVITKRTKNWARMDVTLNSGYTYHIIFHDQNLMNRTMGVLTAAIQNGGQGTNVYVDIESCTLQDCNVTINEAGNEELIAEMLMLCRQMSETQPMIADSLNRLATAMQQQNEPEVKTLLKQLGTGFVADVLSGVASQALCAFLHLV